MKKFLLYPLRVLEGLIDRILAIAGSITLAQFPQFYSQYLQRLGGHLDEARRIVAEYSEAAASFNLTLSEYVRTHLTVDSPVLQSTGTIIENSLTRLADLENSFQALKAGNLFNRWWIFLRKMEPAIFKQTCLEYTPGLPFTMESLTYALIGLLITFGIYQGIKGLLIKLFSKLTHSESVPSGPGIPG